MEFDYPIIDIHTHVNPLHMLNKGAEGLFRRQHEDFDAVRELVTNPDALLRYMDQNGVEKLGMVNYVAPDVIGYTMEANNWAANFARHAPDRLIPFGSVHPRFCNGDLGAEVERLAEMGIRALKIHPPHQLFYPNAYRDGGEFPQLARVYERAEALGLPIMFHTGTSVFPRARNKYGHPMYLDDLLVDFPNLKIIMAHGGRPLWMNECFFLIRRSSNVYMDISSIPPQRLLDYFPRLEEIADRVMFGSDWPGPGPKGIRINVEQFLALSLSDKAKRKILRENALKLFGPDG
jgi:hypothetical protein